MQIINLLTPWNWGKVESAYSSKDEGEKQPFSGVKGKLTCKWNGI